jgi:hypothetical protein
VSSLGCLGDLAHRGVSRRRVVIRDDDDDRRHQQPDERGEVEIISRAGDAADRD